MDQLDLYYRAFREYRKITESHKGSSKHREIISHSNPENDVLEAVKIFCTINEDWVSEIEKGLVFVEKAIKEERQFIRNDGEVVPIEKAKHVDKHSVEHLARHSEYITDLPKDGEDIIPNKLYMLERDSDYAVYENRFLYMLLKYLESFIDVRFSRIVELGNTYKASTSVKKNISLGKRHIVYEATLAEDRRNDPFSSLNDEAKEMMLRIEAVAHWVHALLSTPLMEQVAKVPMVRPPITKTNVLRMNNNFKNAVALYEYVASYEGDGYVIEEKTRRISPFTDTMADDFSEVILLASFLTYEYGNDIKELLRRSYDEQEAKRRSEEQEKLAAQIKALKKRINDMGESPESYMLLLEKRIKALEGDSAELKVKRDEIKQLTADIDRLEYEGERARRTIEHLNDTVAQRDAQIVALNVKYDTDMAALREAHAQELDALCKEHAETLERVNTEHADELLRVRSELAEKLDRAISDARLEKAELQRQYSESTAAAEKEFNGEIFKYREETERLSKENTLVKAQLNGIRHEHGLMTDSEDFSSKERFEELEREFEAFYSLFESEWKKTKKKIRKDILWTLEKSDKDK